MNFTFSNTRFSFFILALYTVLSFSSCEQEIIEPIKDTGEIMFVFDDFHRLYTDNEKCIDSISIDTTLINAIELYENSELVNEVINYNFNTQMWEYKKMNNNVYVNGEKYYSKGFFSDEFPYLLSVNQSFECLPELPYHYNPTKTFLAIDFILERGKIVGLRVWLATDNSTDASLYNFATFVRE